MKNLTRLVVTLFALTLGSLAFAGGDAKKEACKDCKDCKECCKDGPCGCKAEKDGKKEEKKPEHK
ncbi:MAG: hypothetical protein HZA32_19510 [Opitutae bacterium]|nr:hypothetical protein [Opitutae bacterium]